MPTQIWQAGDCFDMAQLLCSLLLGVGYDAYVVSGYAKQTTTHCDQADLSPVQPLPPDPHTPVRSIPRTAARAPANPHLYPEIK